MGSKATSPFSKRPCPARDAGRWSRRVLAVHFPESRLTFDRLELYNQLTISHSPKPILPFSRPYQSGGIGRRARFRT